MGFVGRLTEQHPVGLLPDRDVVIVLMDRGNAA